MPRFIIRYEKRTGAVCNGPLANRSLTASELKAPALSLIQTIVQLLAMKPAAPLLLIDVDGVISLFGFDQTEPPDGRLTFVDGMPHWISGAAGAHLARLHAGFECVWCTGWEDRADEHLPYLLDLPRGWAHLTFPPEPGAESHWKLATIEAYAGPDRAVAWIDDDHDDTCHAWAQRRPGKTLLVATNPAVGITDEHVEALLSWGRAASG